MSNPYLTWRGFAVPPNITVLDYYAKQSAVSDTLVLSSFGKPRRLKDEQKAINC
jgi:hypothetical protein